MTSNLHLLDDAPSPNQGKEMTGVVEVTKDSFFASIGQLDVHPTIQGAWNKETGYTSAWLTRAGRVLRGMSTSGTHQANPQYFVPENSPYLESGALERV